MADTTARPTIRDAEHALQAAGFTRREAKTILAAGFKAIELNHAPRWWQFFTTRKQNNE